MTDLPEGWDEYNPNQHERSEQPPYKVARAAAAQRAERRRANYGEALAALRAAHPGPETIHASGRHLYIDYSALGIGDSKLTSTLMDARLGVRGTGRNWNTVLKLTALAGA